MYKPMTDLKAFMMKPFVDDMDTAIAQGKAPTIGDAYTCAIIETGFLALDLSLAYTAGKIVGKAIVLDYKYVIKPIVKAIVKAV